MTGRASRKKELSKRREKPSTYRRVVTENVDGRAVVQSDQPLLAYEFNTVPGYEHTLIWINPAIPDLSEEQGLTSIPTLLFPGLVALVFTSSHFRPAQSSRIRPSTARPHETKR
jgi:hypothetical protein